MLNPNSRSLYTSVFTPPPGMNFDEAIATTFSMDPAQLLEAPVYLALKTSGEQPDPLLILDAIRRYSKRITVYVEKGRIQVPHITLQNPLFGLLERMIVEVKAPKGGVFHPKVWAIRFYAPDKSDSMIRLVVLTRNMTNDRSWDLSLQIDGMIGKRKMKGNKPLAYFFRELPGFAPANADLTRIKEQAISFSEDIYRAQWELPAGFDELTFYLPGTKKFRWEPPVANRMVVISPFCSEEALEILVKDVKSPEALISTPESLAAIKGDTRSLFSQCLHLHEAAETEDGEEKNSLEQPLATGLHAKAYLFETRYYSDYTHIIMGSANATNAALKTSKNVEILVGLKGKKSNVGGIDELLGEDGLGEYLVSFDPDDNIALDTERREAEACIEKARLLLSEANLSLICKSTQEKDLWSLTLVGDIPHLPGIASVVAWPITLAQDYGVTIAPNVAPKVLLGEFSVPSLTGLIAFELKTQHPDVSARFVFNLPTEGIPEERISAIIQTVIRNQDGFLRYLLLLLCDEMVDRDITLKSDSGFTKWLSRLSKGEEFPILEELIRAYCRHPDKLQEISRLVQDLLSGNKQNPVIPDKFLNLWSIFESALGGRDE